MARRAQHSTRSPALRCGGRGFSFGGTGSFLLSIILLNGRTILEVDSRVLSSSRFNSFNPQSSQVHQHCRLHFRFGGSHCIVPPLAGG